MILEQIISVIYGVVGLLGLLISLGIDAILVLESLNKSHEHANLETGIRIVSIFFVALFVLKVLVWAA